jgi:DNA-binding NarL/FixJ family response regulator
VVADDPLLRERFAVSLGALAVGHASTDAAALAVAIARAQANLVVWDLGPTGTGPTFGPSSGFSFAEVDVPVVVLSVGAGSATPLLDAGAAAVLRRDGPAESLRTALPPVLHGLTVVDPALTEPREPKTRPIGLSVEPLTQRETQVVELVATGLSNKQIAKRLGISAHTVKFHVNAILAKLDVHSRTEAVVRAVQLGVVEL